MELHDVQNNGIRDNNPGVVLPPPNGPVDKMIRFYKRKFHFIAIPLGIIYSAIHLKFGIEYLGQCPIQPMINIYMIVHASVALLLILLALIGVIIVRCIFSGPDEDDNQTNGRHLIVILVILTLVLFLFSFAWLITGSVWIFGAKTHGVQGSNPNGANYCQSDLYNTAFVLIIVNYVVHSIIILLFILRHICCKRPNIIPANLAEKDRV